MAIRFRLRNPTWIGNGLCEATRNEVPTLALVEQVRADGETVARDCGGEYCGWGFAELKDGP